MTKSITDCIIITCLLHYCNINGKNAVKDELVFQVISNKNKNCNKMNKTCKTKHKTGFFMIEEINFLMNEVAWKFAEITIRKMLFIRYRVLLYITSIIICCLTTIHCSKGVKFLFLSFFFL